MVRASTKTKGVKRTAPSKTPSATSASAKKALVKQYLECLENAEKCRNNVKECIEETSEYSGSYFDDPYNDAIVARILREADEWANKRDMYKKRAVAIAKEYEMRFAPEKFPYRYK